MPILMYHVLATPPAGAPYPELYVSPDDFRGQVAWLAEHGYEAVTLSRVAAHWRGDATLPDHPVVLTFDDGHSSVARVALPILDKRRWPAVLNLKVANVSDAIRVAEVRSLVGAGWEIGAHTITHPSLPALDDEGLDREIAGSRQAIQRRFGVEVTSFCYPSGRFDERVVRAVRRAGFTAATTTESGLARHVEPLTLDRVRVNRSDGVAGLAASLTRLR